MVPSRYMRLPGLSGDARLLRLVYEEYHAVGNLADSHGRTALHLAAGGGHVDAFEYLMCLGLDCAQICAHNVTSQDGSSYDNCNAIYIELPNLVYFCPLFSLRPCVFKKLRILWTRCLWIVWLALSSVS